ncbi:DUF975 family protein [Dysosmobacter sp.]|uniref:DUF975 family protein n=1 Tax=Dysosmobacter sp. TaxID=2591382 RepID=UPI002A895A84|nr:DUF975 family protein [Dysosmobacter sp.]MDY3280813.1 DUF975 family protein [Dysosmobacter sp.]
MVQNIDRRQLLRETDRILRDAQVSPRRFFALFLAMDGLMRLANYFANLTDSLVSLSNPVGLFVTILVNLLSLVLEAGCVMYCLGIRRGERVEYLTLFDGFSFVGRVILLYLTKYLFIFLWSLPASLFGSTMLVLYGNDMLLSSFLMPLLLVPPVMALYRYRFAVYNLCERPDLSPMEAIRLSKLQTFGCKGHLLLLDLRFAGWMILSYLPTSAVLMMNLAAALDQAVPAINEPLSLTLQLLFPIFIGVLYLPRYHTAVAGCYEAAVANTGVQPGQSGRPGWDHGPDNLGGY